MYKICVFAGTTEGREVVEFLASQPVAVTACVATEYGETLLPHAEKINVSAKRLTSEEMEDLFRRESFDLVLDATHPYASVVTENIAESCAATKTEYLRLLRDDAGDKNQGVYVEDIAGAVDYLSGTEGPILLTTGSKELAKFTALPDFSQRVYARVLPMADSLRLCQEAGLQPSHILAMQGPFSKELNIAMLNALGAKYLVTKSSGKAGGFEEKLDAARATGAVAVIIGRPKQRSGVSLEEALTILCQRFGCTYVPKITLVGIGPGSRSAQTLEVREALAQADCIIGAKRMMDAVLSPGQAGLEAIAPESIRDGIQSHREYRRFVIAMSGDVGFFSGTKKLLPLLSDYPVAVLPGLSSLVYLCARLGTSYENVTPVSLHGRENSVFLPLSQGKRLFVLVGGENGMGKLCQELAEAGLGDTQVRVGEKLSYPDERIVSGTAEELKDSVFDPLAVALLEHPCVLPATQGLPDEAFLRTDAVPMTKSEVRAICLSKLALNGDSLVWDVGAGTGSVTVEMAFHAKSVYAVERKDAALDILRQNLAKFHTDNVKVVPGVAPAACADLPAPTHVFLGGTSGNLRDILNVILNKNPEARIVATAVTLESLGQLTAALSDFRETEVVSVSVARDRKLGAYHLMTGQNPIYIVTMQGRKET